MAKDFLNEAERYLIKNWSAARTLELSLEEIRTKYDGLFQKVVETVQENFKDLDYIDIKVKQFWSGGYVAIGRQEWRGKELSGFWLSNVRLELLADDTEPAPVLSLWIDKRSGVALPDAKRKILAAASDLLEKNLFATASQRTDEDHILRLSLPEKRSDLLEMLADGDGQRFIDCMAGHLSAFAPLAPVVTEVMSSAKK